MENERTDSKIIGVNKVDLISIKKILKMPEAKLFNSLAKTVLSLYPKEKVLIRGNYIYCEGTIPIAFVSHTDTVYDNTTKGYQRFMDYYADRDKIEIFHDQQKQVLWSPDGLGADDRAGIFMILKLLKEGHRPSVIFTRGEEVGGIGASDFADDYRKANQFSNEKSLLFNLNSKIKYIVQLDRRGSKDAVFYSCANDNFISYITSFGFKETRGSFSDISIICPETLIAGVNLSVGYYEEHSTNERLFLLELIENYNIILLMIKDIENSLYYTHIERTFPAVSVNTNGNDSSILICDFCQRENSTLTMIDDYVAVCDECLKQLVF